MLEGSFGWAHGGVGSMTGASDSRCCVVSEGLSWPLRVLFLPDMTAIG